MASFTIHAVEKKRMILLGFYEVEKKENIGRGLEGSTLAGGIRMSCGGLANMSYRIRVLSNNRM